MKITLLCSDRHHPVYPYLASWVLQRQKNHMVDLIHTKSELSHGDILFLVSCNEVVSAKERSAYTSSLVLHASKLPKGRGWSPHIWELASGATSLTLSLIEARDPVDTGRIWAQRSIPIPPTALWDEINHLLFTAELEMLDLALENSEISQPQEQDSTLTPTYYRKRTPDDSRLDVNESLASQFDLMRVCDPERFPAFFEYRGQRYTLKLEKCNESSNDH